MAQQRTLEVVSRTNTGKGAARTLRRQGKVPAVIYGHGRDAESVTVEAKELTKTLTGINSATTILEVAIDGKAPVKALIRELQRNSIRPSEILHIDLYEVRADEKITVSVPIHLVGNPDGVRNFGGVLDHVLREVEIEVFPSDIPAQIDLDVTALTIGHSLFVRDLKIEKADILNDPDTAICSVVAPRTEEAAAPGEEGASSEPELIRKPKAEDEADAKA